MIVPNQFPTSSFNGLAIVGEAPGAEEDRVGKPFMGKSGQLMEQLLAQMGIVRAQCFIGNVCQEKPPGNDITKMPESKMAEGLSLLHDDLKLIQPRIVLCLGNTPLKYLLGYTGITKYRGSVYSRNGRVYIPAIHPAAILREWSYLPSFIFDIRKVSLGLKSPSSLTPVSTPLLTNLSAEDILSRLRTIASNRTRFAFDIEGIVNHWNCCSICPDDTSESFTIDWVHGNYGPATRPIFNALADILEDDRIPKVLQNYMYDAFVLAYSYRILIRGPLDDTMLKHWENHPELPKSLGFQTSIYTVEPYHKDEGRDSDTQQDFLRYCAKDSLCTILNDRAIDPVLSDGGRRHYRFNLALLRIFLYMQIKGIRYDTKVTLTELQNKNDLQVEFASLKVKYCVGYDINVKSSKQMKQFLYTERGYPPYLDRKTGQPTANAITLLKLAEKYPDDLAIRNMLELRRFRTQGQMLSAHPDPDGRIRCSYNVVGTETGRLTCYESNTGNGYNLQTVPKALRVLFKADPGYVFFQCDLSGADAWTVAARCAALGDPTMLSDLKAGIKIAKLIVLLFREGESVSRLSRDELVAATKGISSDDRLYFGSKCVQHGTNYMMGIPTMSDLIFKMSDGEVSLNASICKRLQQAYLTRYYGIPIWHRWIKEQLRSKRGLTDASGHFRRFWGLPYSTDTLKAACAHEPQANTTYATNLAALRLWRDPANRERDGGLRIQPLHQVHDALCGQFPAGTERESTEHILRYFDNRITIADQELVIPFEGGYGPDWGTLPNKFS